MMFAWIVLHWFWSGMIMYNTGVAVSYYLQCRYEDPPPTTQEDCVIAAKVAFAWPVIIAAIPFVLAGGLIERIACKRRERWALKQAQTKLSTVDDAIKRFEQG